MQRIYLTLIVAMAAALSACADNAPNRHHGVPPQDPPDYHGIPTDDRPPMMIDAPSPAK